jgi:predicted transposase YdaD
MKYVTAIERMAEARGEQRGEQRGEARGEKRQKRAIALNLLQQDVPLEVISKATGFLIAELKHFSTTQLQQSQADELLE